MYSKVQSQSVPVHVPRRILDLSRSKNNTTQKQSSRLATKRIRRPKVPVCPGEGKTRHGMLDLDDGAVEELLFGWFEG